VTDIDATQALKDAENSLRDFIAFMLSRRFGEKWEDEGGVTLDRLERWRNRKTEEAKRQQTGIVEQRLIYYADFYDLSTILKKHWSTVFSEALGDWKTYEVFLDELEKLRDPDAHRRELLPHQKHLIIGIAGEIRTRIVRYRSKQETSADYYPRIESVADNLGNIYTYGMRPISIVFTKMCLRIGDFLQYVVIAMDPLGQPLNYRLGATGAWQPINVLSFIVEERNVAKTFHVYIQIQSQRKFHAVNQDYDDIVLFQYEVLPPK
jgi:hypothetical protein